MNPRRSVSVPSCRSMLTLATPFVLVGLWAIVERGLAGLVAGA